MPIREAAIGRVSRHVVIDCDNARILAFGVRPKIAPEDELGPAVTEGFLLRTSGMGRVQPSRIFSRNGGPGSTESGGKSDLRDLDRSVSKPTFVFCDPAAPGENTGIPTRMRIE